MESRLFLATVCEERSLVIPHLWVTVGGQTGFGFQRHPVQIRGGPQLQTGLQKIATITRRERHSLVASRASGILPSRRRMDGVTYAAHSEPASRRTKSRARWVLPSSANAQAQER